MNKLEASDLYVVEKASLCVAATLAVRAFKADGFLHRSLDRIFDLSVGDGLGGSLRRSGAKRN
ncbi:hypothetical protein [Mesorhizobium marinum]|uniref:hypothetical protein n=1 Tax=Mesorhizobium marinum TaxID=3228790 RepID=UPI0034664CA7